ncbi:cytochrome C biogenesis protein [Devosia sp. Root413D1]|nr:MULTISPECIES: cytochrome c biogenesis protein CcdA [unclassified Devosia]KQU96595.1 cytochrome C biogenesis protein [Devosia sp. Root105]KQW76946.1 cytochrome C biogenesis protein [Devosia sp. Root413D1]
MMDGFSFWLVFGAGVLSFLSPCVLPLVPPYLTYMSGASFDQLRDDGATAGVIWRKSVFTSLFFIAGFSIVFILFGATATAFGQAFRQALPIITPIAGLFIIAMGLHFLGVYRIAFLDRQLRHNGPGVASGPVGGFLLGLAFAVGWTPCIGPVLAAILAVASTKETALDGAALLGLYSLGLGVPFLLAGIAIGPFLTFFSGFKKHLGMVEKVMGALLVVTGLLFLTGQFTRISYWFLETFPVLQQFG